MNPIDTLANRLRPHYSRFLSGLDGEVLMTGHSHQAWPDISRDAQLAAWDDAARLIDGKWGCIFGEKLPAFQKLVAARIGSSRPDDIALGLNTHELVYRLLSSLPPSPTVVTTDAEFHSLSRQLRRIEEEGATIVRIDSTAADLGDQLVAAIERVQPSLLAVSYVFFTTSRVLTELPRVLEAARANNSVTLVDAYHGCNTMPLNVQDWPGDPFVVGGGYKYAQSGEGVCWMLLPEDATRFRPRQTGWFADFGSLEASQDGVGYGPGAQRFGGATFDPSGLYRAVAVLEWMDEQGLDPAALRAQSSLQTQRIVGRYDASSAASAGLALATPREASERGAFVTFERADAKVLGEALGEKGIRADTRGPYLRFGPAPYTTSEEIDAAVDALVEVAG